MYGFAPLYEIQKTVPENNPYVGIPHYGKFLHSFNYMGEAAVVLQLPFLCISLYANGYSYPKENFNFGLNIWLPDLQSKNVRLNSQKVVETFAYLKQKRTFALAITKQWPRSSTE